MITIRRANERFRERQGSNDAWLTFPLPGDLRPLASGFGPLEGLTEGRLPPSGEAGHIRHDTEVITYVRRGMVAYEDSQSQAGLIQACDFHLVTMGHGLRCTSRNASPTTWAHVFHIWLRASTVGLEPSHEQKRFSVASRRGLLRVVASPDGRDGSLRVHQDACLYSGILNHGRHVAHPIDEGRGVWLHVVDGRVSLGEDTLDAGDGAGVTDAPSVSLTARTETEILLLDLPGGTPTLHGAHPPRRIGLPGHVEPSGRCRGTSPGVSCSMPTGAPRGADVV